MAARTINRKIAEIIGLKFRSTAQWPFDPDDVVAKRSDLPYLPQDAGFGFLLPEASFQPETNWDAAFWSLEMAINKLNFWGDHRANWDALSITPAWGGHELKVRCWMCNFGDSGTVAFADTIPMAVCNSILKVAETANLHDKVADKVATRKHDSR